MIHLRAINKICAYPGLLTWASSAIVLDLLIIISLPRASDLDSSLLDLLKIFIPSTLLAYFLGMFTIWPFIRNLCSKINGAPLALGDKVKILKGKDKGRICEVYETPKGQGAWELARVDLGSERKKQFKDIFEQYELQKMT